MKKELAIFEGHKIRRIYDEKTEMWFSSVVDIIQVLTDQPDYQGARNCWKVLKNRLNKEGSQTVTNCNQSKIDIVGKMGEDFMAWIPPRPTMSTTRLASPPSKPSGGSCLLLGRP